MCVGSSAMAHGGASLSYALTELYDVTTCVWEPLGHDSRGGVGTLSATLARVQLSQEQQPQRRQQRQQRRSETQLLPSSTASNDSDDKESRGELDHESSLVPSGPTVHLHYNGCSHYCVFVASDVDEDQMMVPSPVRGRTLTLPARHTLQILLPVQARVTSPSMSNVAYLVQRRAAAAAAAARAS